LSGISQEIVHPTPAVVTTPIDASQRLELANTVRLELKGATDQGRTDGSKMLKSIMLSFAKTPAQETALRQLLADQLNPASPEYHQWLTPEQYGERFGANPDDIANVVDWLGTSGFSNIQVAYGKNFVTFDGNVATTETALGTEIHNYTMNGETHFANSTNVEVPAAFGRLIKGVSGLHDFHIKPMNVHGNVAPAVRIGPGGIDGPYLAGQDIPIIYDMTPLYNAGYTGTGVDLAIVGEYPLKPGDSSIAASLLSG
jgi:subtilase family serine protease